MLTLYFSTQTLETIQEQVEVGGISLVQALVTSLNSAFSKQKDVEKQILEEISEGANPGPEILFRRNSNDSQLVDVAAKKQIKVKTMRVEQAYSRATQMIMTKVTRTPARQMKNIMLKRTLLKQITQIYDEKITYSRDRDNIRQMPLSIFIYAQLQKKYGLLKVAGVKFEQLTSSALKYRQEPRILMFARFLGLFEPISTVDLEFYLKAYERLREHVVGLNENTATISLQTVLDTAREIFQTSLTSKDYFLFLKELQSIESYCDVSSTSVFTHFEPVLKIFTKMFRASKESLRSFVQYIYDAADLNHDGSLEYSEFRLLVHYLSARTISESAEKRLFDEYADLSTENAEDHFNAISFSNFAELAFSQQLFTQDSFFAFVRADTLEGIETLLSSYASSLPSHSATIHWRLRHVRTNRGELLQRYFARVVERLKQFKGDPQPYWVALRIIEEESKAVMAATRTEELMPRVCKVLMEAT